MKTRLMLYALTFFASLMLVASCCPCRKLGDKSERLIKDSVSTKTEIKWKDSTITTASDSAEIMALVFCPPNAVINTPTYTSRNNQATVTAAITNNQLVAKCKCDGLELKIKLRETTIEKYKFALDKLQSEKTIRETYIPKWVKILAAIGAGLSLFEIGKLVFTLYKKFVP